MSSFPETHCVLGPQPGQVLRDSSEHVHRHAAPEPAGAADEHQGRDLPASVIPYP